MQLCPEGHQIPEWANDRCPLCDDAKRKSWQRGTPKPFNPGRYFDRQSPPSVPFPPQGSSLPPDKQMPNFDRLSQPEPKPPATDSEYGAKRTPGMVLLGIKQLLAMVCGRKTTLEAILSDEKIASKKVTELINARHPFITEVREGWFILFKAVLIREEARVVARSFGLDGLSRAKDKHELAKRCKMSVSEMERLRISGIRKLTVPSNRNALIRYVAEAAKQYC